MSGTELLVIVFGLFLGYWVVAKFGADNTKKEQRKTQHSAEADAAFCREQSEREQRGREEQQRHTAENYPPSWHEVLNVSSGADTQEIRRAYKSLMSQYHPDKVASLGPELKDLCERKTKEINSAYDRAMAERGATL
jgi:DnaJ like chaperone protein